MGTPITTDNAANIGETTIDATTAPNIDKFLFRFFAVLNLECIFLPTQIGTPTTTAGIAMQANKPIPRGAPKIVPETIYGF